ncbi:MAG: M15 family metallopeptidase [Myxococcales bacterium]|nr:M15 family metallopeptidase [Myxococcales bacterium]
MPNTASISELSPALRDKMRGVSWHEDLPSPDFEELRLLQLPHVDFEGREHLGQLITVDVLAHEVVKIFAKLRERNFPIHSIRLMHCFEGDDEASMAANNSSCFNSRHIMGSTRVSLHTLGRAIDINPVHNPVVRDGVVRPDAGRAYCDRQKRRPGMFYSDCEHTAILIEAGWKWGGNWDSPKDYHHFFIE